MAQLSIIKGIILFSYEQYFRYHSDINLSNETTTRKTMFFFKKKKSLCRRRTRIQFNLLYFHSAQFQWTFWREKKHLATFWFTKNNFQHELPLQLICCHHTIEQITIFTVTNNKNTIHNVATPYFIFENENTLT